MSIFTDLPNSIIKFFIKLTSVFYTFNEDQNKTIWYFLGFIKWIVNIPSILLPTIYFIVIGRNNLEQAIKKIQDCIPLGGLNKDNIYVTKEYPMTVIFVAISSPILNLYSI